VLIDAGGDLRGLPAPLGAGLRDPGARDVLPALAALGVSRLALVVLTHPHPDHAGGLPSVLRALPVDALWMTSEPGPGDLGGKVRGVAEERGVPVHEPSPGERFTSGGASLEVLAPAPRWSPARSTNDNSLVLRVDHGAVSLLLAGDAEALEEAQLAQGPRRLRAQLLKAGHHGSRTSTTDAFLRAVSPEVVVFSAGLQNPFGFPHKEVVARAEALGARVLTTQESALEAESDGRTLRIRPFAGR
jgi:competence protein ComEC